MLNSQSRTCVSFRIFAVLATLLLLMLASAMPVEGAKHSPAVRIGIAGSLFRDVPQTLVQASLIPLQTMMEAETGIDGDFRIAPSTDKLAEQLATDKVQLAVFHGFEFAWARQQYPGLVPLVVVVSQVGRMHAYLVVRRDTEVTDANALRNKTLAVHLSCPEHCRLYIERRFQEQGKASADFFARVTNPPSAEDALDDVVEGVVQAAVVDGAALACYERRKPGRFEKLKVAQHSEDFPAAVVAYRAGVLDDATLTRFRDGMIQANQRPTGKQLLTLWKIGGFARVPEGYERNLVDIAKAYPRRERIDLGAAAVKK